MTKSVPLLRVATDTRDSAGNLKFFVAIEKQGRFIGPGHAAVFSEGWFHSKFSNEATY